jgi:hypothetical protein
MLVKALCGSIAVLYFWLTSDFQLTKDFQ